MRPSHCLKRRLSYPTNNALLMLNLQHDPTKTHPPCVRHASRVSLPIEWIGRKKSRNLLFTTKITFAKHDKVRIKAQKLRGCSHNCFNHLCLNQPSPPPLAKMVGFLLVSLQAQLEEPKEKLFLEPLQPPARAINRYPQNHPHKIRCCPPNHGG